MEWRDRRQSPHVEQMPDEDLLMWFTRNFFPPKFDDWVMQSKDDARHRYRESVDAGNEPPIMPGNGELARVGQDAARGMEALMEAFRQKRRAEMEENYKPGGKWEGY